MSASQLDLNASESSISIIQLSWKSAFWGLVPLALTAATTSPTPLFGIHEVPDVFKLSPVHCAMDVILKLFELFIYYLSSWTLQRPQPTSREQEKQAQDQRAEDVELRAPEQAHTADAPSEFDEAIVPRNPTTDKEDDAQQLSLHSHEQESMKHLKIILSLVTAAQSVKILATTGIPLTKTFATTYLSHSLFSVILSKTKVEKRLQPIEYNRGKFSRWRRAQASLLLANALFLSCELYLVSRMIQRYPGLVLFFSSSNSLAFLLVQLYTFAAVPISQRGLFVFLRVPIVDLFHRLAVFNISVPLSLACFMCYARNFWVFMIGIVVQVVLIIAPEWLYYPLHSKVPRTATALSFVYSFLLYMMLYYELYEANSTARPGWTNYFG